MKFKVGDRVKWGLPLSGPQILGTIELVLSQDRYPYTVRWDNGTLTNYAAEAFLDIVKQKTAKQDLELIQEKEQVMKFKVGDRVKTVAGSHLGTVNHVNDSKYPYIVRWDNGMSSAYMPSELELIQPEVQEPVPGRFYRTRDGSKFKFLMKATKSYLYEAHSNHSESEFFVYEFEGPYLRYTDGGSYDLDIVGEWTEETKFVGPWEENP